MNNQKNGREQISMGLVGECNKTEVDRITLPFQVIETVMILLRAVDIIGKCKKISGVNLHGGYFRK